MHPKVLSASAWETVRSLVDAECLEGWTLAGGTGLALQLGHRYSEDLDFFRAETFDAERVITRLSQLGGVKVQSRSAETLHVLLRKLRVSFLRADPPLLFPGTTYRGMRVADPRDIAVMKVVAIGGRGIRRDFVDLYFFLRAGGNLDGVFALLRQRFEGIDFNEQHLLKSLVYFDDAEDDPMPRLLRPVEWEEMKKVIRAEVRRVS